MTTRFPALARGVVFVFVAVLVAFRPAAAGTVTRWRDLVANCAETLINEGTDRYGTVHSDMFVTILDVETHTCPEDPLWLDAEAYFEEGRSHRRAMGGANFWYDQSTISAMYRLSEMTGDARFASGADRAIDAFFDHAIRSNGMPAWGTHTFYNVFDDAPEGDGLHETLVYDAQWDKLYDRRPAQTQSVVDRIWQRHLVDYQTGRFNRHDDNQLGCDFAFSGGSFIKAMAAMYAETGRQVYMDRALTLTNWHWSHRNPTTNLIPDAPSTYPRYDSTHCFTTVTGPYADQLLEAYELTGEATFLDRAVTYLKAYDEYGWDEQAQSYWAMLKLDGTPVPEQPSGSGYDYWAPYGHVDVWKTTIYSYEFPLAAAESYAKGYAITGDADLLRGAQRWATVIRNALPVQLGNRFGDAILEALPETAVTGGSYAEDYGRVVNFFTQMYDTTGEVHYLQTAEQVAQDAVDKLYTNDIFRGHPAKPYYEATNGVGLLLDALLDLDEVSDVRPDVPVVIEKRLEPVKDVWIREVQPQLTYEDDLLSVWGSHAGAGTGRRYALLEFDVGEMPGVLRGAKLDLFAMEYSRNEKAFAQKAVLLVPTEVQGATWANYETYEEISLDSLGALRFEEGGVQMDRYWSSSASEADVETLRDYLALTGGKIAMALAPLEMHLVETVPNGRREWADLDYYRAADGQAKPATLVLNGGDYVLTATSDGWVREVNPGAFYENDLVSVWANENPGEGRRYGLLTFDLSQIDEPITDAVLRLYACAGADHHNSTAFEQYAYVLDTTSIEGITWNNYENLWEYALSDLGHFFLDEDSPGGTYYDSAAADGSDLALLEAARLGAGILALSMKAPLTDLILQDEYYCGERDWADTNYVHADAEGRPPRLILYFAPLDGDLNADGLVNSGDLDIVRANWGRSANGAAEGDASGDGTVGSADLDIIRANWGAAVGATAVPEPGALGLLLTGLVLGSLARARRPRRDTFPPQYQQTVEKIHPGLSQPR